MMHNLTDTLRIATESIWANALRAGLTILGIVIGVAAVIAMVAVGSGAQRAVEEQIASLGAQLITIYPGQSYHRGVASNDRTALRSGDAEALAERSDAITDVLPELEQSVTVKFGGENINASVLGTTPNFTELRGFELSSGRMFTRGDGLARRRYAVLGAEVPRQLSTDTKNLLEHGLYIRGIPFEVIGVLAAKGSDGGWSNPDERILIPLETAQLRVFGTDRLRSISVRFASATPAEQGMVEIERILRREHSLSPGQENDFMIRNRQDILTTQQETSRVFAYLLASIAAISLLVGGIGIMNIMLVSVTERTREIGIRKALGATRAAILRQFLIESLLLCMAGGAIGVLCGWLGARALSHFAGFTTSVSVPAIALAFVFSAAVGLGFGLWPARRAANLNPVDALRYE